MIFACFLTLFVDYSSLNTLHLDPLPSCLGAVHDSMIVYVTNNKEPEPNGRTFLLSSYSEKMRKSFLFGFRFCFFE